MSTNPLRLLHTCFSRSWGGLELYALDVSRLLRERDHAVWLACPPQSRLDREARTHALPCVPLPVTGYVHPFLIRKLARFIRTNRINLIHCHQSRDLATVVSAMLLSRTRAPIVLSKSVGSYIMKRDPLHRFTYAHVSRVLAISSVIHNNVLSTTPVSPERVTTLHFPVDTVRFDPDRVDPHRVREEFNISKDELLVGLVGRFSPGKGHEDLLAAAELLRPRHPNLRFLLVGEASYGEQEYGESIKTLVRSSGMDDRVIFTGFRTDTPEIMAALDILVFPSPAEAFGMVLIEAMSMRLPVVSTNCDGVLDIVVDGVTGLYIDPHAPGQLADAISRFVTDPDLRRNMGRAGRERAVERFDRQSHLDRLEAIYREIYARDGDGRYLVTV